MLDKLVKSLVSYCNKDMVFQKPPRLFLKQDEVNSSNPLGKTAHYQPGEHIVTVYISGRHPKDILRSIAHELVHHHQNERGDFDGCAPTEDGYAQNDEHLRNMEKEAYLRGNMLFRDWEDSCKKQMQMEAKNKMKLKELKELIKETIIQLVKERVTHTRDGIELAVPQRRAPGDFGPRAVDTRDYKREAELIKTSGVPPLRSPEYIKAERQFYEECKDEGLTMGSSEHRACVIVKLAERGLREVTDGEQQIEEGDCGSGKREDKKSKKKCPHCDGNAPESECINKPQKKNMKEGNAYLEPGTRARFLKNPAEAMATQKKHIMMDRSMVESSVDKYLEVLIELLEKTRGQSTVDEKEAKRFFELRGGEFGNPNSFAGPESGVSADPNYKETKPYGWQRDQGKNVSTTRFEESKVMTVEKEKALKENYMGEKRNRLFEMLSKKWSK